MSQFQTCLCHSVTFLGKTFYGAFPWLAVLESSSKFQSYLYKTKNSNKKIQLDNTTLTSPEAGQDNCLAMYSTSNAFLRVKGINIEIK